MHPTKRGEHDKSSHPRVRFQAVSPTHRPQLGTQGPSSQLRAAVLCRRECWHPTGAPRCHYGPWSLPPEGELHVVRRGRPEERTKSYAELRPPLRHPSSVGRHARLLEASRQGGANPCSPSHWQHLRGRRGLHPPLPTSGYRVGSPNQHCGVAREEERSQEEEGRLDPLVSRTQMCKVSSFSCCSTKCGNTGRPTPLGRSSRPCAR